MEKQMMSMEELEQVTGGNIFTDAWDWLCDKFSSDDQPKQPKPGAKKRETVNNLR